MKKFFLYWLLFFVLLSYITSNVKVGVGFLIFAFFRNLLNPEYYFFAAALMWGPSFLISLVGALFFYRVTSSFMVEKKIRIIGAMLLLLAQFSTQILYPILYGGVLLIEGFFSIFG